MKVKKTVSLPHNDLEWFDKEYKEINLSAVLTLLLHQFRSIHQEVGLTPRKAARDSAKEVKEMKDEGFFERDSEESDEDGD